MCDNTPIRPLYDDGIRDFIVVYLDRGKRTKKRKYPEARILDISPSRKMGSLFGGELNFSSENIKALIELGYRDAKEKMSATVDIKHDVW